MQTNLQIVVTCRCISWYEEVLMIYYCNPEACTFIFSRPCPDVIPSGLLEVDFNKSQDSFPISINLLAKPSTFRFVYNLSHYSIRVIHINRLTFGRPIRPVIFASCLLWQDIAFTQNLDNRAPHKFIEAVATWIWNNCFARARACLLIIKVFELIGAIASNSDYCNTR